MDWKQIKAPAGQGQGLLTFDRTIRINSSD
jgi:hypothetical protein